MSDDAVHPPEAPKSRSRLMALLKPIAIVAVVVILECVAAAMLLPTLSDTQKLGKELAVARAGGEAVDSSEAEVPGGSSGPGMDIREVNLGSYHIAVFQPKSSTTLRIDLELYGTVLANELSAFEQIYPRHEHRLSEQVHATFRAAEITDLTDAGLGLIKRRILEKSNRTLGKPLLKDVVFSKFSFLEQ